MGTIVITAPAQVVTTADLRKHLRYATTTTEQDTELVGFLNAAHEYAQGYCNQSFGSQTLELALDAFPEGPIKLDSGPVTAITSVKYIDTDGVEQTLSSTLYTLDSYSMTAYVTEAFNTTWPETRDIRNAVKVRYVAGATALPGAVRSALLIHVAHLDQNRGASSEIPEQVDALLSTAKSWGK
jgi:uncharacterized phiE125 gp8 family phage protein